MIGASLMLFEFCSRLFSLEAQCRKLFGFMYGPAGRVSFFIVVGAMCSVIDTIGVVMGGASLFLAVLNYGIIHQNPKLFQEIYDVHDFDDPSKVTHGTEEKDDCA